MSSLPQGTTLFLAGSSSLNAHQIHYNVHQGQGESPGRRAILEQVVAQAMHDSGEVSDLGHCHPGTRISVQEQIRRWIDDLQTVFSILWLYGAAGAGKSSIMRTIASALEVDDLLLGSFFCWALSDLRNNFKLIIPTLVEQIICRIPEVVEHVEAVFKKDPRILTKSLEVQATRLIVDPLSKLEPPSDGLPRVILIDGVDEIKGEENQVRILKVLAHIARSLPNFPIRILIASREETHIRRCFDLVPSMRGFWTPLCLNEELGTEKDLFKYYTDNFADICASYPHLKLDQDWPGEVVKRLLIRRGSGQWIFAATVVRFISLPVAVLTIEERLDIVTGALVRDDLKPLEQLDLLYASIFRRIPEGDLSQVLLIVGTILLHQTLLPNFLDQLFGLRNGTVRQRLSILQSIIKCTGDDGHFIIHHHSLDEFLFNHSRSYRYGLYIQRRDVELHIINRYVNFANPAFDFSVEAFKSSFSSLSTTLHYAVSLGLSRKDLTHQDLAKAVSSFPPLESIRAPAFRFIVLRLAMAAPVRSIRERCRMEERRRLSAYFRDDQSQNFLHQLFLYPFLDEPAPLASFDECTLELDRTIGLGFQYIVPSQFEIHWEWPFLPLHRLFGLGAPSPFAQILADSIPSIFSLVLKRRGNLGPRTFTDSGMLVSYRLGELMMHAGWDPNICSQTLQFLSESLAAFSPSELEATSHDKDRFNNLYSLVKFTQRYIARHVQFHRHPEDLVKFVLWIMILDNEILRTEPLINI